MNALLLLKEYKIIYDLISDYEMPSEGIRKSYTLYPKKAVLFTPKEQTPCLKIKICIFPWLAKPRCCLIWQGKQDLNSRHSVLETDVQPTELFH